MCPNSESVLPSSFPYLRHSTYLPKLQHNHPSSLPLHPFQSNITWKEQAAELTKKILFQVQFFKKNSHSSLKNLSTLLLLSTTISPCLMDVYGGHVS